MKNKSKNMSLVQLVYCTYFKCGKAMEEVIINNRFMFCILLNFLVPVLFYAVSFKANLAWISSTQGVTDPELCRKIAFVSIGVSGVQNVALWFLRALLIFILLKVLRAKGTFRQVMAICGIAYLAIVPMMLVMGIAGQFTGDMFINFSPAVFIPQMRGTMLYGLIRGLCLFFMWEHVLIAIGLIRLTGKKRTVLACAAVYLIQIFINMPNMMYM